MKRTTEQFVKANYSAYERGALLSYAIGMSLIVNQQAEASLQLFRHSVVHVYSHILLYYKNVEIGSDDFKESIKSVHKHRFYGHFDKQLKKFIWNEEFVLRELKSMNNAIKQITEFRNSRYEYTSRLSEEESNLVLNNAKQALKTYFTKIRKSEFSIDSIISDFTMEQQEYIKELFTV